MEKEKTVNLEIPSRWRRESAYLLDLIINFTIIWLILNIIVILSIKTTLWNMLLWIKTLNNKNNSASLWQNFLRYLVFYQTLPLLVFCSCRYYYFISWGFVKCRDCDEEKHRIIMILLWICLIFATIILDNIIEIFFKCPTFVDKRSWIKRIYKKSK